MIEEKVCSPRGKNWWISLEESCSYATRMKTEMHGRWPRMIWNGIIYAGRGCAPFGAWPCILHTRECVYQRDLLWYRVGVRSGQTHLMKCVKDWSAIPVHKHERHSIQWRSSWLSLKLWIRTFSISFRLYHQQKTGRLFVSIMINCVSSCFTQQAEEPKLDADLWYYKRGSCVSGHTYYERNRLIQPWMVQNLIKIPSSWWISTWTVFAEEEAVFVEVQTITWQVAWAGVLTRLKCPRLDCPPAWKFPISPSCWYIHGNFP